MGNFFTTGPFWAVYVVLFLMAMARGQMMYWIGRIPTEQALKRTAPTTGWRARAHRWLSDGGADAGVRSIQRWGLPVVSFCYVTVGFQSLVQAAAGMLRIPLLWYILAQIPGSLAWAAIYSTIGFGLWAAIIAAAAGSPAGPDRHDPGAGPGRHADRATHPAQACPGGRGATSAHRYRYRAGRAGERRRRT
ncbi:DedA family protein [Sanguibacter sp. Z1732]|uniref:DedA family protein n=1 Tax=Sanguibacter sp. Z1732 TaxID=3435412 RepID=UPI003D9C88D3